MNLEKEYKAITVEANKYMIHKDDIQIKALLILRSKSLHHAAKEAEMYQCEAIKEIMLLSSFLCLQNRRPESSRGNARNTMKN